MAATLVAVSVASRSNQSGLSNSLGRIMLDPSAIFSAAADRELSPGRRCL
jgi:hypothetical protein